MAIINLNQIKKGKFSADPYPHLVAKDILSKKLMKNLAKDFPGIDQQGFFPLEQLERKGSFDELMKEFESPEFSAVMTDKLGIELRDKPKMITIRKWSAFKDGRIHTDGEAKIATALLYLNEGWPQDEDGGRFRVLRSDKNFDDSAAEIPPIFGSFVAFVRKDHSWHGHKPFAGERRVVQITWLRSWEDMERKGKRGAQSLFLKRLLSFFSPNKNSYN